MLAVQPLTPTIVKIVPPPTAEVSVLDVLAGSVGLTGVIVVLSMVLGLAVGGLLIAYSRWRLNRRQAGDAGDQTRLDLSSPITRPSRNRSGSARL
jgi:hypothetical protein